MVDTNAQIAVGRRATLCNGWKPEMGMRGWRVGLGPPRYCLVTCVDRSLTVVGDGMFETLAPLDCFIPDMGDPGTLGHARVMMRRACCDPWVWPSPFTKGGMVCWRVQQTDGVDAPAIYPTESEAVIAAWESACDDKRRGQTAARPPASVFSSPDEASDSPRPAHRQSREARTGLMKPFSADELDPGIRQTVLLLRAAGFRTGDSGDGQSKPAEQIVLDYPHVAAMLDPDACARTEARRAFEVLQDAGYDLDPLSAKGWMVEVKVNGDDMSAMLLIHGPRGPWVCPRHGTEGGFEGAATSPRHIRAGWDPRCGWCAEPLWCAAGTVEASAPGGPDLDEAMARLAALDDGWLDGESRGLAPSAPDLATFKAWLLATKPDAIPVPHIYPTEAGGILAEWTFGSTEASIEVDRGALRAAAGWTGGLSFDLADAQASATAWRAIEAASRHASVFVGPDEASKSAPEYSGAGSDTP